jgi:biotin transport system substrate-specific component
MSLSATSLRSSLIPRSTALSHAVLVVSGVLGLAALAQIAIPVPGSPVPVTGQTLGVLILGTAYGSTLGFTTFAVYILAGIAGAPVFADGEHGLDRIVGATGGYLVGMLVATFVLGQLARFRLDQKFLTALPSMLIGTVTTFSFGLIWLHQYTGQTWSWTFEKGLTPFIVGEVLKIAIAGTSLPAIWRVVNRKNSQ